MGETEFWNRYRRRCERLLRNRNSSDYRRFRNEIDFASMAIHREDAEALLCEIDAALLRWELCDIWASRLNRWRLEILEHCHAVPG